MTKRIIYPCPIRRRGAINSHHISPVPTAPMVPSEDLLARLPDGPGTKLCPFLAVLNGRISSGYEVTVREEGDPLPAEETLKSAKAACRDLAMLFIECCRILGIATRFVSGYQQGDQVSDRRDMHAWAEVYLPGGGWRGYDPTYGLAVADRHIAVAASATPRLAGPLSGSFRGSGVTSTMETKISLETIES